MDEGIKAINEDFPVKQGEFNILVCGWCGYYSQGSRRNWKYGYKLYEYNEDVWCLRKHSEK